VEVDNDDDDDKSFYWKFCAFDSDQFARKCTGFIHEDYNADDRVSFTFSVSCSYPFSVDVQTLKLDGSAELRKAQPSAVMGGLIIPSILTPYRPREVFPHLKFMELWMVAAKHLQDDATEFARLQSRFGDTYILVEVREIEEENIGKTVIVGRRSEVPDQPMTNTAAYALVPLSDQEALLALFTTQSARIQFLSREGKADKLPPAEHRVVRISVLDLESDRVIKLGEGDSYWDAYADDEDSFEAFQCTSSRHFYCFEQIVQLTPSFEDKIVATVGEESTSAVTVKLSTEILGFQGYNETPEFTSVLELWKFLEICLTGETS